MYLYTQKDTKDTQQNTQQQKQNTQQNTQINFQKQEIKKLYETQNQFLNKIYNPLERPDTVYNNPYNQNGISQQVGYLFNSTGRYPVFGRPKDSNRNDRMEYYTIDNSEARIKIPFQTKNFQELYDKDQVKIPDFGDFTFKKYDQEELKYN